MTAQAPNSLFDISSEAQSARRLGKRGSRAKLAEKALNDLCQVWDEQGIEAVRRMAFHDPSGFVKTVTALLPQKIEHTFPTDGLSDDRLADLLEIADTMAKRLGIFTDEKRLIDVTPERGAGGPDRVGVVAGEGCPSPDRDAATPVSNGLEAKPPVDSTVSASEREENDFAMQPPVGKPFPTAEHDERRSNLRKLNEDEIDPSSLF